MDETHDPARTSWVPSAQGHPDFPIQNLPFGIFHRVDDKDDPWPSRVGMAIGDFVLDLTACHDEGWFTGAGRSRRRRARRAGAQRLDGARPRDLARGAAPGERHPGERLARLSRQPAHRRPHPRADGRGRAAAARRGRRLHRLLRLDPPRDQRRQHVPARQPAAAQLQVGADRLPRPGVVAGTERHAGAAAERTDQGPQDRRAGVRAEPRARLRDGSRLLRRDRQPARRAGAGRGGRRAPVRPLPGQRLVRPRRAELGVPAARPLPGEEFRDHGSRPGS